MLVNHSARRVSAAVLAVGLVLGVAGFAAADDDPPVDHVSVLPGEGLWTVASRLCPHAVNAQFQALLQANPWASVTGLDPGTVLHWEPSTCPPTTTTSTTTSTTSLPSTSTTPSTTTATSLATTTIPSTPPTTSPPSVPSTTQPPASSTTTSPPASTVPASSTTTTVVASTSTTSTTLPSDGTWHGYTKPGPNNTGPTGNPATFERITAAQLTARMTPGAVITNVYITGGNIGVPASNVTIRNFVVDATGQLYGFALRGPGVNLTLEDGEIFGPTSTGILGMGYTARRLEIHHIGNDAFKAQNAGGPGGPVLVESSWWHHLGVAAGAHGDGNQTLAAAHPVVFRGNNCDMPRPLAGTVHTSCLMIKEDNGPVVSFVAEYNWLNGGSFTIYCKPTDNNVTIRENRFGRQSLYGVRGDDPCDVWTGNVWDDTGGPVAQGN